MLNLNAGHQRRQVGEPVELDRTAMIPDDFRRLALSMPKAAEKYRRGRSEFRVERKTFACLEGPADTIATIHLTTEQQAMFMHVAPRTFVPVLGGWGRLGATRVVLANSEEAAVEVAIAEAWRNMAPRALLRRLDEPPSDAS